MYWIFLSPHLDDAVFSCGGIIHQQILQGGRVEIWTLFASQPAEGDVSDFARRLHARWNLRPDPVRLRREEDAEACGLLGAVSRQFDFLDCIYRSDPDSGKFLYQSDQDLFGGIHPGDEKLQDQLASTLEEEISDHCVLAAPLGIGNHIDHSLVRKAASRLNREVVYYPDYPYLRDPDGGSTLEYLEQSPEWEADYYTLSDRAVNAWVAAAAAYRSQLSSFWEDRVHLEGEIRKMVREGKGCRLWKPIEDD